MHLSAPRCLPVPPRRRRGCRAGAPAARRRLLQSARAEAIASAVASGNTNAAASAIAEVTAAAAAARAPRAAQTRGGRQPAGLGGARCSPRAADLPGLLAASLNLRPCLPAHLPAHLPARLPGVACRRLLPGTAMPSPRPPPSPPPRATARRWRRRRRRPLGKAPAQRWVGPPSGQPAWCSAFGLAVSPVPDVPAVPFCRPQLPSAAAPAARLRRRPAAHTALAGAAKPRAPRPPLPCSLSLLLRVSTACIARHRGTCDTGPCRCLL